MKDFSNSLRVDRRLFRAEIRASVAHCNALFRAGILTRIESERLKNALWTIVKRADFDRHFFDGATADNVFAFVEARLFQLVNEAANALAVGRSSNFRAALALRLWLREEIEILCAALDDLQENLTVRNHPALTICAANATRDGERLRDCLRRVNQIPAPQFDAANETTAEFDFQGLAHELGLTAIDAGAPDAMDFCVEFVAASALSMLHLANFSNVVSREYALDSAAALDLATMRGKSAKIFGHTAALLALLQNAPTANQFAAPNNFPELCEIMFEAADTLRACLQAANETLKNLA